RLSAAKPCSARWARTRAAPFKRSSFWLDSGRDRRFPRLVSLPRLRARASPARRPRTRGLASALLPPREGSGFGAMVIRATARAPLWHTQVGVSRQGRPPEPAGAI